MSRWEDELGRVSWATLSTSDGLAAAIPGSLVRLRDSATLADGWQVYWELDNNVVVQGNLFAAAEAVIPFVVELAIENDSHVRLLALELLIQLVGDGRHPLELKRGNDALADRCRDRAREGLSFYYSLLDSPSHEIRDRAVELIGFLEPDTHRKEWTMTWVSTHDPNNSTRDLAARLAREAVVTPATS